MKKLKYILFTFIFFFLILNVNAESFDKNTMDIYIDNSGNAHVTEVWTGYFNKNTELYKRYNNLGESKISNLRVSFNGITFKDQYSWDIHETFEYKKYKSAITYKDGGTELCFGISEYGHNTYIISYEISDFIRNTEDGQIINWNLIDQIFKKYEIKVHSNFKYEDIYVKSFGDKGAKTYVEDGIIYVKSKHGIKRGEYEVLFAVFKPNTFNTDNHSNRSNTSNYYLNNAIKDYKNQKSDNLFNFIGVLLFPLQIILIISIASYYYIKTSRMPEDMFKNNKTLPKDVEYFRDIPCNKDLFEAYSISDKFSISSSKYDIIGSLILKWILEKRINIKTEEKGIIFKENKTIIIFTDNIPSNPLEEELYNLLISASKNGELYGDRFNRWFNRGNNKNKIDTWLEKIKLNDKNSEHVEKIKQRKRIISNVYNVYDDYIYNEAIKLKGLKKYFIDFTRMYEKMPIEVHLWKEYLIFAQLFGLADKVAEELKMHFPEISKEFNDTRLFDDIVTISSSISDFRPSYNYSSGGGSFSGSSSGGGGSSSSGGGGGGSR